VENTLLNLKKDKGEFGLATKTSITNQGPFLDVLIDQQENNMRLLSWRHGQIWRVRNFQKFILFKDIKVGQEQVTSFETNMHHEHGFLCL
jgi:hypothetical protein